MAIEWRGSGLDEQGVDTKTGNAVVKIDARYFRPAEVECLQADATKARRLLGWAPSVSFDDLVRIMVEADIAEVDRQLNGGREALRGLAAGA